MSRGVVGLSREGESFRGYLRLDHLDVPNQLLAFALTALKPIRDDYATAPYLESFNWSEVFALLRTLSKRVGDEWKKQDFYVVIFRSQLKKGADRDRLGELDQMSHQEVCLMLLTLVSIHCGLS